MHDITLSIKTFYSLTEKASVFTRSTSKAKNKGDLVYNHSTEAVLHHHIIYDGWQSFTNLIWSGFKRTTEPASCACGVTVPIDQNAINMHSKQHESHETVSHCALCNELLLTWSDAEEHLACVQQYLPNPAIVFEGFNFGQKRMTVILRHLIARKENPFCRGESIVSLSFSQGPHPTTVLSPTQPSKLSVVALRRREDMLSTRMLPKQKSCTEP